MYLILQTIFCTEGQLGVFQGCGGGKCEFKETEAHKYTYFYLILSISTKIPIKAISFQIYNVAVTNLPHQRVYGLVL